MRIVASPTSVQSADARVAGLRQPSRAVEALLLLLLLAAVVAAALLVRVRPLGYPFDLTGGGYTSPINVIGFHGIENNADFSYRWTSGYAFVQLPNGYNAAPRYRVMVRLRSAESQPPRPLTFLANERPLAVVTPETRFRTYELLLPDRPPGDANLRFALQIGPASPPGEERPLGVITTGLTLAGVPYSDGTIALILAPGLLALWLLARRRGGTLGGTTLFCLVLAAALLALVAVYRPAPLNYHWLLSAALAGALAATLLARATAARLALSLLAALVSFSGALWPSWLTDDAFISFRYAQNLVAGNGLVYNVGERVEGYTNFLWTMLAALVLWLQADLIWTTYLAGVGLALAIMLLTYGLGRRLLGPGWALIAALFVATSQSLLIYTARGAGLETGLFTLLALVGSACFLRWRNSSATRDAVITGLVFALATLTRPEGGLLMALSLGYAGLTALDPRVGPPGSFAARLIRMLRLIAPMLAAYLVLFLPYFGWRVSYYGDLLPNTFYAKTGGGIEQVHRGLEYATSFAMTMGGPLLLLALAPLVAGVRAVLHGWQGYLLLLTGVYSAYIVAVGGDHFPGERFFVPLVPWYALLLAGGIAFIYVQVARTPNLQRLAAAGLALLLIGYSAYALSRSEDVDIVIQGNDESVWIWRELGWWLADHSPPDATSAALGAGAVAFYSDRTTIDLLGLTDRHIARQATESMGSGVAGHEKRDPDYVLNERRPTYIPRKWDDYFGGAAVLRADYRLITVQTRYGRSLELWERRP